MHDLCYLLLFILQINILFWSLEFLTRQAVSFSSALIFHECDETIGQTFVTLVWCLFTSHSREHLPKIQSKCEAFGLLSWLLVGNTARFTKYARACSTGCATTVSSSNPKVASHSAFLLAHYIIPAARWRNAVKDCPRKIRTCAHVVLSTLGIHPRRTRSASNLFIGNFADNRCSIKLPPLRTCSREYLHSMHKLMARHASSRLTDSVAALSVRSRIIRTRRQDWNLFGRVSSTVYLVLSRTADMFLRNTRYGREIKVSLSTGRARRFIGTIISVYLRQHFHFIVRWLLKRVNKGVARTLLSPDSWWASIYSQSLRNI